jgi:hypothetical protein
VPSNQTDFTLVEFNYISTKDFLGQVGRVWNSGFRKKKKEKKKNITQLNGPTSRFAPRAEKMKKRQWQIEKETFAWVEQGRIYIHKYIYVYREREREVVHDNKTF